MAEVGVVLKVPQGTHTKLKAACNKHDRSMQKVLLALIEGWVANGAPDPITYGKSIDSKVDERVAVDLEARQSLKVLSKEIGVLKDRLNMIDNELARASVIYESMKNLGGLLDEGGEGGE